jgi:hypothetical protein
MDENLQNGAAYEKMCWYSLVILEERGCVFPQVRKCGSNTKRQGRSKGKKQWKMQEVEK